MADVVVLTCSRTSKGRFRVVPAMYDEHLISCTSIILRQTSDLMVQFFILHRGCGYFWILVSTILAVLSDFQWKHPNKHSFFISFWYTLYIRRHSLLDRSHIRFILVDVWCMDKFFFADLMESKIGKIIWKINCCCSWEVPTRSWCPVFSM